MHEAMSEASTQRALPVVSGVHDFEKIGRVGEGTYGIVYKARDRRTGDIVALKKLRMDRERDGMPVTSVRELRVLQACRHENLVHLRGVVTGSNLDSVYLVFEYIGGGDLARVLDTMDAPFQLSHAKALVRQLLKACEFLHNRWIVHRDLKLSNLLVDDNGVLKLCDFGLARYFKPFEAELTGRVVTLWYRAPEVLLGSDRYNESVDMWACGCIMAELLRAEPLFPAKTELETMQLIMRLLGTPTGNVWPGFTQMPSARQVVIPNQPYNYLKKEFAMLSDAGVDLMNAFLTFDPDRRISAKEALQHPWFTEHPLPQNPKRRSLTASNGSDQRPRTRTRRAAEDHSARHAQRERPKADADARFDELFGSSSGAKRQRL